MQTKIKKAICPVCDGSKQNPDKPEEKCPECQGTGYVEIHNN